MGIASILNIAKNAMAVSQTSVQVTSHNVANVNTAGYSRQTAILEEAPPMPTATGLIGNGVVVTGIKRYCDKFLDSAIAGRNGTLQQQQTTQKYFERIQTILDDDNSNLTKNITDFFNGWQQLSTDPTSMSVRTTIVSSGQNLSDTIRNLYGQLKDVQYELDSGVEQEISDINRLLSSIADLNNRVFDGSSNGGEAADFVDQRNEFFKELSGKLDVTSVEDKYGRITILTGKGKVLVDGGQHWDLEVIPDTDTGFNRVAWKDHSGNLSDITDQITSGTLKGLTDVRDQYIGDVFVKQLDELAKSIITNVNQIHKTGVTLNNTTGIPFFNETTGNYAENMNLTDAVKWDVRNVAATSSAANPADNDIALSLAALGTSELSINGMSSTLSDYVASVIGNVGELTKNAQSLAQFQQDTMTTLENQRASVSGVSIDEEMANLIKFQYAYQAAARLFTVADELFQSLLGTMR